MKKPHKVGTQVFWDDDKNNHPYEIVGCDYKFDNGIENIKYNIKNKITGAILYGKSEYEITLAITSLCIDELLDQHQFYSNMYKNFGDIEYQNKLIVIEDQLRFKSKIHKKV